MVPQFAVSRSDVGCLLAGIYCDERQLISRIDRYKKDILRRKRRLVMFVSRHRRELT